MTEKYCTRSWDNTLSDCLPLMTRAAKPLWGVTSSVAAIVYSSTVVACLWYGIDLTRMSGTISDQTAGKNSLIFIMRLD